MNLKLMHNPIGKKLQNRFWIAIVIGGGGEELLLMLFFFSFFYLDLPLLLLVLTMLLSSRRSCDCHDYKTRDKYQTWVPQMGFMLLLNNNDCKETKVYHVNGDDWTNAALGWSCIILRNARNSASFY